MSISHGTADARANVSIYPEHRYRGVDAGSLHVLTQVTAPTIVNPDRTRPPLDLAFVVDRSGSMGGGKLDLARHGVNHALRLLDERDSISLIVYDDEIDTLLTQQRFTADAHGKATRRLARIHPRGSTDLAGGWLTGCDQLAAVVGQRDGSNSDASRAIVRVLLLTDGLANVGMTDPSEIAHHAAELADRGISTSTLGVGDDYDEDLLAGMADEGKGHFYHIEDATAIPRVFADELQELLEVGMRDVVLSLRLPNGWHARLLNDLPLEREGGWISVRLGEFASRETRSLMWEFDLPDAHSGSKELLEVSLRWLDADGLHRHEQTFSQVIEARVDQGSPNRQVQDELAQLIGARARAEAVRFNKAGQYELAQTSIQQCIDALPPTEVGREVARELDAEVVPMMARPASKANLKRQYAYSRNVQRSRRDYTKR